MFRWDTKTCRFCPIHALEFGFQYVLLIAKFGTLSFRCLLMVSLSLLYEFAKFLLTMKLYPQHHRRLSSSCWICIVPSTFCIYLSSQNSYAIIRLDFQAKATSNNVSTAGSRSWLMEVQSLNFLFVNVYGVIALYMCMAMLLLLEYRITIDLGKQPRKWVTPQSQLTTQITSSDSQSGKLPWYKLRDTSGFICSINSDLHKQLGVRIFVSYCSSRIVYLQIIFKHGIECN